MIPVSSSELVVPAARQAALLLHALSPSDRAWLLAQLPSAQRAQLMPLVDELQALGIPQDLELVEQTLTTREHEPAGMHIQKSDAVIDTLLPPSEQLLSQLDSEGCAKLADLLRDEPPMLIARLLLQGPWAWEEQLLKHFGALQRKQIEECRSHHGSEIQPGLLSAAIMDTITERLRTALSRLTEPHLTKAARPMTPGTGRRPLWTLFQLGSSRHDGASA
jgi:hypothetical protein